MRKNIVVLVLVGVIAAGSIFAHTFDLVKPHKIDEFEVFTKKEAGLEQTFFRLPNPPQHEQIFADNYVIYVPNKKFNVSIIAKKAPTELVDLIAVAQAAVTPWDNVFNINEKNPISGAYFNETPKQDNSSRVNVEIGKTFIVMLECYSDYRWIMNAFDNNEFEAKILSSNDYVLSTFPSDDENFFEFLSFASSHSNRSLCNYYQDFYQKEHIALCFKAKKTGSFLLGFTRLQNPCESHVFADKEVIVNVLPPQNEVY